MKYIFHNVEILYATVLLWQAKRYMGRGACSAAPTARAEGGGERSEVGVDKDGEEASREGERKGEGERSQPSNGSAESNGARKKDRMESKYEYRDSANLFWGRRPYIILHLLQIVYFGMSMQLALSIFTVWLVTPPWHGFNMKQRVAFPKN
jgi:hypothetical protein